MVTDFVISTIQYIEKNLQAGEIGAIIIVALILLVIRGVQLWYWRVNKQIYTLEKIDKSLLEIKENLCNVTESREATSGASMRAQPEETVLEEEGIGDIHMAEATETNELEPQMEIPKMVFDKKEENGKEESKLGYSTGKNGMTYAEEILREQIQF